uniref:Uncharacterized protein n=1 Tax=Auxenochlorella protothecoides TaxID=3075 RepID=A0A1D2ABQ3_AUXPR
MAGLDRGGHLTGTTRVSLNHRAFGVHRPPHVRPLALHAKAESHTEGVRPRLQQRADLCERQLSSLDVSTTGTGEPGLGGNILPHARPRRRLKVAVDVDEVLGRFLHSLNQFCLEEHGREYQVSDYFLYDFAKVWKCSQEASNVMVHNFFKSHHFSAGIQPIPGALESLKRLQPFAELVVVTSRQHVIQEPTLDWVETHFPQVFSSVHFGNHYALEGASLSKVEMCRGAGAQVLVDDNPRYAEECAEEGLHVLLFDWEGGYPWASTPAGPSHPRITRVHDWAGVERELHALSRRLAQEE